MSTVRNRKGGQCHKRPHWEAPKALFTGLSDGLWDEAGSLWSTLTFSYCKVVSGDRGAYTNDDKHQIALISVKTCLCFSHFVAQVMAIRREGRPLKRSWKRLIMGLAKEKKAMKAFMYGGQNHSISTLIKTCEWRGLLFLGSSFPLPHFISKNEFLKRANS